MTRCPEDVLIVVVQLMTWVKKLSDCVSACGRWVMLDDNHILCLCVCVQTQQITPQLALQVLLQFDKAINTALASRVRNRVNFRVSPPPVTSDPQPPLHAGRNSEMRFLWWFQLWNEDRLSVDHILRSGSVTWFILPGRMFLMFWSPSQSVLLSVRLSCRAPWTPTGSVTTCGRLSSTTWSSGRWRTSWRSTRLKLLLVTERASQLKTKWINGEYKTTTVLICLGLFVTVP